MDRFGGRRLNVGMDIYNAFNSDAAQSYCNTYPTCGSVAGGTLRPWLTVERLVTPRYARFQVQFDF